FMRCNIHTIVLAILLGAACSLTVGAPNDGSQRASSKRGPPPPPAPAWLPGASPKDPAAWLDYKYPPDQTVVPGQYLVVLKESLPWQHRLGEPIKRSADPAVESAYRAADQAAMQADGRTIDAIAQELTAKYHVHKGAVLSAVLHAFFVLNASDSDMRQMAHDPRISIISPHVI